MTYFKTFKFLTMFLFLIHNNIFLLGKINRKVVKQTVMTVVYGVTFIGGRLQIEKQLKDLNVDKDIIYKSSVYIVKQVFSSITEMFTSARQIQDWLATAARQISQTGNCVDWVTPVNLPVLQPYYKKTKNIISTPLQIFATYHSYDFTQLPDLRKQKGKSFDYLLPTVGLQAIAYFKTFIL